MAVAGAFQVATSDLIQQVRDRLDIGVSQNPPDTAILAMLNQAFRRYYDLVVEAYGEDYFIATTTVTTTSGIATYNLPSDFYKVRWMDLIIGGTATQPLKIPIRPFPEELRDSYGFGNPQYIAGNQQILVTYTPRAPLLVEYASLSVLTNDGIDSLVFTAQLGGLSGNAVKVALVSGGSLSVSVTGLTVTVTYVTGTTTAAQIVAAVNASAAAFALVEASATQPNDTVSATMLATALSGVTTYDFVNGWERLVIADVSAQIASRLELDPSVFLAEKAELKTDLAMLAQTRDSGHAAELKDEEAEEAVGWPWAPPSFKGYRYKCQGNNPAVLWLIAIVPALPSI
jgi:hypothetical protein